MSTTFFSKKKLPKLQARYVQALLQSLGYNKNTSKSIRYGSPSFAGIGIKCLYLEQGISCIYQFLRHWRSNTQLSKLLRITVTWCQSSLGTSIPFLQDMEQDLPHFESKWLKNIRAFLRHCNSTIELDNPQVPAIQRINDQHIMDLVLDSKSFKPTEISHINRCRLYL